MKIFLCVVLLCIFFLDATAWIRKGFLVKTLQNLGTGVLSVALLTGNCLSSNADDALDFGLKNGGLLKCKTKSNCISTSSINSVEKYGRPWVYADSSDKEFQQLLNIVQSDPYLKLAEMDPEKKYIHITAKSAFPPDGIDDFEFIVNDQDKIISYRGNSRTTVSIGGSEVVGDAGALKNRLSTIQRKLQVREMAMDTETENFLKEMKKKNIFELIREASQPNEINFIDNTVPTTD